MGRYDFRPARVRQAATLLLNAERLKQPPPWFQVMHDIPPSEMLVRTQPVQHVDHAKSKKVRRASRMFQPQQIAYEEDKLRTDFFGDHPWELARPRVVLENDGKDHHKWDWSKKEQPGRPQSGESVIQRQKWLMTEKARLPGLSKDAAYDKARKELYQQRHRQEIESRIAREEALHTGATFGKTRIELGMGLENATFDRWKEWAKVQVSDMEQARNAAYTGLGGQTTADELSAPSSDEREDNDPLSTAASLLGGSIPNSSRGQTAQGGAAFRP